MAILPAASSIVAMCTFGGSPHSPSNVHSPAANWAIASFQPSSVTLRAVAWRYPNSLATFWKPLTSAGGM